MAENLRHNSVKDLTTDKISPINYENIFNVHTNTDSQYYYNILKTVIVPQDLSETYYSLYTIKTGDTWTGLSKTFYGDVRAWWIICIANNIFNPTEMPTVGKQVKILTRTIAKNILSIINTTE